MSVTKRIAFAAASTWFYRGITILLGIALMPILFRHLPREDLGVWLLLGQSWAALGIFDLGFGVTLTRRIAFAIGKSRADPTSPLTAEPLRELANLAETGRIVYLALAITAFLVTSGAGFFSLRHIHLSTLALPTVWIAWEVVCLTQALSVWSSVWDCLLQGVGYVGWDAILASFTSSIVLTAQIVVALLGGGLIGLAIVAAVGALTQRSLILLLARRKQPEVFSIRGSWDPGLLKSMAPLALKAWITALGIVVVTNSDQYFIAGLQGPKQIPAYRAAYVVFVNLNMLAGTLAASSSVFVAQLWRAGDIAQVQRIVSRNLRLGLLIMASGGGCVLALGERLFNLWLGRGNYIGATIATIFFVQFFFEVQSFIIITSSRATEDEAFATLSAVAATLKVILSWALGKRFGLLGIAMGTLCAQFATSYWYMCYRGLRRLQMGLRSHFTVVLLPVGILFLATLVLVRGVSTALIAHQDWMVVGAGALAAATMLVGAIWIFVLDVPQREFIFALPARVTGSLQGSD